MDSNLEHRLASDREVVATKMPRETAEKVVDGIHTWFLSNP
jgi:hypothetical protein